MEAQIKPGYKQTEAGVIPEDWELIRLGDVIDKNRPITYGIVIPGPFIHNGIPLIRAQDYSKGWVDLNQVYRVSFAIDASYKRSRVIDGDVLLTIVGSVGKLAKVPSRFSGSNITQQTARLAFHHKVANADYYLNVLDSNIGKKTVSNYVKSGVQPSLNLSDVEKFVLPQPPTLAEQERIANALSDVDGLIEGLQRLIEKKRLMKQGAMQELLTGRKRLPGFSGEWTTYKLDNLLDLRKSRLDPRQLEDGKFCIELEHIEPVSGRLIGGTITNSKSSLKSVFKPGDVLFGKLRSYLRKYWQADRDGVCSTEFWVLSAITDILKASYLFQVVKTEAFVNVSSSSYGTHMPRSDWNVVKQYEIRVPPLEEQEAIATTLSDMDTEIEVLEQKLAKYRQIKQGMMQELLTGKTRLVEPSQGA